MDNSFIEGPHTQYIQPVISVADVVNVIDFNTGLYRSCLSEDLYHLGLSGVAGCKTSNPKLSNPSYTVPPPNPSHVRSFSFVLAFSAFPERHHRGEKSDRFESNITISTICTTHNVVQIANIVISNPSLDGTLIVQILDSHYHLRPYLKYIPSLSLDDILPLRQNVLTLPRHPPHNSRNRQHNNPSKPRCKPHTPNQPNR